jgi:hypothetical protein
MHDTSLSAEPRTARGRRLRQVARLQRAPWGFTTRRVSPDVVHEIRNDGIAPQAGDLVLARIEALGHHRRLQLASGRRRTLFTGDDVVVAYGDRYAPSQFEAVVPQSLGPCHLVAGGGVAGKALSWHSRIARGPTEIRPIGLLADAGGQVVNVRDHALHSVDRLVGPCPVTIAVVGTAMDSGKTQSAAYLVRGLTRAGLVVGFAKVTGTGAGGDTWLLTDAGAGPVFDFTDAGYVSTYRLPVAEVERILVTLVSHLRNSGVDAIVLEIADGILQQETAALLRSEPYTSIVGGTLLAARDSMGADSGVGRLRGQGLNVIGLSGVLTSSPLQCGEAIRATGVPVFSREDLARAATARTLIDSAGRSASRGS